MKKIIKYAVAAVVLFCISFVGGCVGMDIATAAEEERQPRMVCVEEAGNNWRDCYVCAGR